MLVVSAGVTGGGGAENRTVVRELRSTGEAAEKGGLGRRRWTVGPKQTNKQNR